MTIASDPAAPAVGECHHERSHIVDSSFYGHRYGTKESHRIFCDLCRYQRWLDVEAALALSQAELGIIPQAAAGKIAAAARLDQLDLDAVRAEIHRTSHSLVGFLRCLQQACEGDAGEYVHYGATTQDIQDTAQALEMREVLDEMDISLRAIIARLAELADDHAVTVSLGRTHAQPALPMGFGVKLAGWLDELLRHAARIAQLRPRVLAAQLFGGVGTMAGFGDQGLPLLERFASRLGLTAPTVSWHVSRDRVVEYVSCMAMVAATMGRIGDEIRTLSRAELAEVELGWRYGQVGSSTMPHKRNPEACEQAVVMARLTASQVGTALQGMSADHERDSRALRLEWACVPDASHYALLACEIVDSILSGLRLHPDRMRRNAAEVAEQIATERLMLAIGEYIGKQSAHEYVYRLAQTARTDGTSLRELARRDGLAGTPLDDDDLDRIFDPARYLGQSRELTDRAVAAARHWLPTVSQPRPPVDEADLSVEPTP